MWMVTTLVDNVAPDTLKNLQNWDIQSKSILQWDQGKCGQRLTLYRFRCQDFLAAQKWKMKQLVEMNFPMSCSRFHSLACSFGDCNISSMWIWPVPFPHALPALANENLSINAELWGFSPVCVRSSHFTLHHHCILRAALPCLHGAITTLAHLTSISFPLHLTG